MKTKLFSFFVALTIFAPTAYAIGTTAYENSVLGVKMDYPQDWEKKEEMQGSVVAFVSPRAGKDDQFAENVNLMTEILPAASSVTLEQYTEATLVNLKKVMKDQTTIDSGSATLAGLPAYEIVHTGTHEGFTYKTLQIWTLKNNKAYLFTYMAGMDGYDQYLKDAEGIFKSFEIVSPAATSGV